MYSLDLNVEKNILYQAGDDVFGPIGQKTLIVTKVDKVKERACLWTFTVSKDDGDPIALAHAMGRFFVSSKMSKVSNYLACLEHGEDNENWHCHVFSHHSSYFDLKKIKNLKLFKNRRIDMRPVKPTIKDLERVKSYVLKDVGKYPEVIELYGNSVFSNFISEYQEL